MRGVDAGRLTAADRDYWFAPSLNNPATFHAAAAWQRRCAGCGVDVFERQVPWHAHHVLRSQDLRRVGGPEHHHDDALLLCTPTGLMSGCHARHHDRIEVVRTINLPVDAVLFCVCWLGAVEAVEYLRRYYDPAGDTRLDRLVRAGEGHARDLAALRALAA